MASVRQVFHVGVAVYYIVMSQLLQDRFRIKKEVANDPAMKVLNRYSMRYLTNWTFILQAVYFFIALGEEVLCLFRGREKIKQHLNTFKNYFFTVLVAPMALAVTVVFWSIWCLDRELIFPTNLDKILPPWVNHALHTTTSVLVLFEMYLSVHKYPAFKPALLGITLYLALYVSCLLVTYFQSGIWLYPMFKIMSWTLRTCICLGVYALALALYGAGYFLNKALWDENLVRKATKMKHKKQ